MDKATFEKELQSMSRFPEAVLAYARSVGPDLSDSDCATMLESLKSVYGDYEPLEQERMKMEEEALAELVRFRKEKIPALQHAVEDQERAGALQKAENDMQS